MLRRPSIAALVALCLAWCLAGPCAATAQDAGPQPRLRVEREAELLGDPNADPPAATDEWLEREASLARRARGDVLRYGNLLALRLTNGHFVLLPDITKPNWGGFWTQEVYRLTDIWPELDTYVVQLSHGEGDEFLLISRRTAEFVVLGGVPHRNPWNPGLVMAIAGWNVANAAVEVWRQDGALWRREYGCRNWTGLDTEFVGWEAADRAVLRHYDPETGEMTRVDTLSHTPQGWRGPSCADEPPAQ